MIDELKEFATILMWVTIITILGLILISVIVSYIQTIIEKIKVKRNINKITKNLVEMANKDKK